MQPNSDQQRGGLQVPSSRGRITPPSTRQAATDLMRQQIDRIYDDEQPNEKAAKTPVAAPKTDETPLYHQTHSDQADIEAEERDKTIQAHWQKYHTAWQQYYQMYYERYYQTAVQKHIVEHDSKPKTSEKIPKKEVETPQELTKDQAVTELRSELLQKVRVQTDKIRKSRHFMPTIAALGVMLVLVFLQYNQVIFAYVMAYTAPSSLEVSNSFITPDTDVAVGPEPLLIIPKLGIQAPVIYGLTTLDEPVVEAKLQNGVVHYPLPGANAIPGQVGNTVILGHSANDVFAAGNYKFVFLRLEQLQNGDYFYINYNSKRYTYVVTDKKVIAPEQVSSLIMTSDKPLATLVTCVPVGTSRNRLLVTGEQRAPDPAKATAVEPNTNNATDTQSIGGGSKSFFERLFTGN